MPAHGAHMTGRPRTVLVAEINSGKSCSTRSREGANAVPDDDHLLTNLIAAEAPWLQRRALSLLHNRADADDLVQDCLTRALSKKPSLNNPSQLRGWMLAILRNLFRARLRS